MRDFEWNKKQAKNMKGRGLLSDERSTIAVSASNGADAKENANEQSKRKEDPGQ
jgi:hypothetical protein